MAFALAAFIAAVPAVAPPLTPSDQQVAAVPEQTSTDTLDLLNVLVGGDPAKRTEFGPGGTGLTGTLYELIWGAADGDSGTPERIS